MRKGKIVLIVLLAALALGFTGILIWGIRAGEGKFGENLRQIFSIRKSEHTQNVDLEGIREICLDYGSVDLTFAEGDGSQMILTEYFSGDPEEENYAQIQRNARDGQVTVTQGKNYLGFWFFSFGSGLGHAEITLPKDYAGKLTIRTDGGDVKAENLSCGSIAITAGSGDIRLEGLENETLSVTTGSGDVHTADCRAELELTTGSGDVRVENQTGAIRAETGSGDVDLLGGTGKREVKTKSGDLLMDGGGSSIQAETGSGDVHIRKLEESSFSLQTETSSGDLEGPVFRELGADEDAEHFRGIYGQDPEFQVEIRTGSGDIKLE